MHSYPTTACLNRLILLPSREFLDTLSQVGNAVVIYQPIWSLKTFGKSRIRRNCRLAAQSQDISYIFLICRI